MRRKYSTMTYRLHVNGQLVQATLWPGTWRGLEKRAAAEDRPVEEVIAEYLAPLIPGPEDRRAA